MDLQVSSFLSTVIVGVGATLFMDLETLFLKPVFGSASSSYCLVGRWLCHMPKGTFTHPNIAAASHKRFECAVGWIAHYALGILYALALMAIVSTAWLARPTILPAILFGTVSLAVPFLVMQPAFGLGVAASKGPAPMQARLKALMGHTAFGFGLYVSALSLSYILGTHA